jgi:hypothetical protein
MIDYIELKLGKDRVLSLMNPEGGALQFDSIELAFDNHYGLRIQPDGEWTVVSFREAGGWSKPEPTRMVAGKAQAGARPSPKSKARSRT